MLASDCVLRSIATLRHADNALSEDKGLTQTQWLCWILKSVRYITRIARVLVCDFFLSRLKSVLGAPTDKTQTKTASTRARSKHPTMPEVRAQSPASLSIKSFISETLLNFSPCSSPTCEYCEYSLSLHSTPSTSPWMMVSKFPVSHSAQDVWAAMIQADAEPAADNESSPLVTEMMNATRARADYVPGAIALKAKNQAPLPLTPEQLDFDERVEAAIAKSSALIAEAKAQLAAPRIAPGKLTEEEQQEARRNAAWNLQYQKKNQAIDEVMERNQALFGDVMATIDDMEARGIPIPNCSDLGFSWESNAGLAGTLLKAGE
jgi:hypothetical protein